MGRKIFIVKLQGLLKEYNSAIHRTMTVKLIDVKPESFVKFGVNNNTKNLNLRHVIFCKSQSIKIFQKDIPKFAWKRICNEKN